MQGTPLFQTSTRPWGISVHSSVIHCDASPTSFQCSSARSDIEVQSQPKPLPVADSDDMIVKADCGKEATRSSEPTDLGLKTHLTE